MMCRTRRTCGDSRSLQVVGGGRKRGIFADSRRILVGAGRGKRKELVGIAVSFYFLSSRYPP